MIEARRRLLEHRYEAPYALDVVHKHIPEMTHYAHEAGLSHGHVRLFQDPSEEDVS